MLQNMTLERHIEYFASQVETAKKYNTGARFRAIYKTETNDYCRENAPASIQDYPSAVEWAHAYFNRVADALARDHVIGFAIEYW